MIDLITVGSGTEETDIREKLNELIAAANGDTQDLDGKLDLSGGTMTGELDMGGNKVSNVTDGADPTDAVNKGQLDAASANAVTKGGQPGALTFGTTDDNGITMLLNGNPFMIINSIGNTSFNTGTAASVPFLFGGGIWTQAGSVVTQINPTSGTDAAFGTESNHPVNLVTNGNNVLTLGTDGTLLAGSGYTPSAAKHLATKDYVDTAAGGNVKLTGAQTIADVKTFSSSPIVPVPSDGTEAANKNYVDAQITTANQTIDARLSAAQRTAIDALDPATATVTDVVNALQAT